MEKYLNNQLVRYGIVLAIGAAIGAIFYPTKHIEREVEQKYQAERQRIEREYSSKISQLQEEKKTVENELKQTEIVSNHRISTLKVENRSLKQKVKERKLKIVKPDGTIVEESVRESETEAVSRIITDVRSEFNTKVKSIENKWKTVHEKRVRKIKEEYDRKLDEKEKVIASLKAKESIKSNPRSFGVALGRMTDDQYYGNISYDVYGPWFINFQGEMSEDFGQGSAGIGIGLRF